MRFSETMFKTNRLKTRAVMVGTIGVGGDNPIRIQSMTSCPTHDVPATIEQIIKLADSGCEIARVTVQGMKEADACEAIKNGLIQKGYTIPLVADIHFYPPAALRVVDFVDKVRINPGNFVDKHSLLPAKEYDEASYLQDLKRIEEKFIPLIEKCKLLKRAMRIGTNHGSLSDRILNRYGNTPKGMVESALEYAKICRQLDYHDIIFSMKASNPQVMMQAYRLLVLEMNKLAWEYPLHLGVTEAGLGEDGRVKSSIGIGSLLLEGIGDTIRVSLTEDPWNEIDPCKRLIRFVEKHDSRKVAPFRDENTQTGKGRRTVEFAPGLAFNKDGTVIVAAKPADVASSKLYQELGCVTKEGDPQIQPSSVDYLALSELPKEESSLQIIKNLQKAGMGMLSNQLFEGGLPLVSLKNVMGQKTQPYAVNIQDELFSQWSIIEAKKPAAIILGPSHHRLNYCRQFFSFLQQKKLAIPVILHFSYNCSKEDLVIQASAELGSLLCDGLGEGIWIDGPYELGLLRNLSFTILQACRMRSTKADFISCPGCGRTLFNLQETTKQIRAKTSHLSGVKIAIVGCIVNGPGEMADADFGYVGSKEGKIDLYLGKECVEKEIDCHEAGERLIQLIKKQNRWVEPKEEEVAAALQN